MRSDAVKWLAQTLRREQHNLERTRRRFVIKPTEKRLHELRTTGRRLRSLLEDAADLIPSRRLLRRVKRASAATDAARDASIILRLLQSSAAEGESELARSLLEELRRRERLAMQRARSYLRRVRFSS